MASVTQWLADVNGKWNQKWQGTGGAAHVIVSGGYVGPESELSEGQTVAVGAASAKTGSAIVGTTVDVIYVPDLNAFGDFINDGCFIQIAPQATVEAVANDDYYIAPNTTYRFSITSGYGIACIQSSATTGDIYIHPVS